MPVGSPTAERDASLQEGNGHMMVNKGAYDGTYLIAFRFGEGAGTNPEELIGAAHATDQHQDNREGPD